MVAVKRKSKAAEAEKLGSKLLSSSNEIEFKSLESLIGMLGKSKEHEVIKESSISLQAFFMPLVKAMKVSIQNNGNFCLKFKSLSMPHSQNAFLEVDNSSTKSEEKEKLRAFYWEYLKTLVNVLTTRDISPGLQV